MSNAYKRLMVSADDFGISQTANDNILTLAKLGKLDRVAVMTQGKFTATELQELQETKAQLDIHLNSADEIANTRKLSDGVILRGLKFLWKLLTDYLSAHSNELQWDRQLQDFHNILGKYPDGINFHQHIHFFPLYFKTVSGLAQKYDIKFIRFGKKSLIKSNHLIYYILYCLRKIDQKKFLASKLESSDHMISLDWISDVEKFLVNLPEGTTEVVCHPERPEEFEIIKKYF